MFYSYYWNKWISLSPYQLWELFTLKPLIYQLSKNPWRPWMMMQLLQFLCSMVSMVIATRSILGLKWQQTLLSTKQSSNALRLATETSPQYLKWCHSKSWQCATRSTTIPILQAKKWALWAFHKEVLSQDQSLSNVKDSKSTLSSLLDHHTWELLYIKNADPGGVHLLTTSLDTLLSG